jgi:hypothetical protein
MGVLRRGVAPPLPQDPRHGREMLRGKGKVGREADVRDPHGSVTRRGVGGTWASGSRRAERPGGLAGSVGRRWKSGVSGGLQQRGLRPKTGLKFSYFPIALSPIKL